MNNLFSEQSHSSVEINIYYSFYQFSGILFFKGKHKFSDREITQGSILLPMGQKISSEPSQIAVLSYGDHLK